MARKSITTHVMLGFALAFAAIVFMLGYLVGSRPTYYGTNLAVRVQQLSYEIRRCHAHLNRTSVNADATRSLLVKVGEANSRLEHCESAAGHVEAELGACNNRYDADAMKAHEEMAVQPDSDLHAALVDIRSKQGTGNIGQLLREIDENNGIDKRTVIRVLLKDIAEKREEIIKVKSHCDENTAAWKKEHGEEVKPAQKAEEKKAAVEEEKPAKEAEKPVAAAEEKPKKAAEDEKKPAAAEEKPATKAEEPKKAAVDVEKPATKATDTEGKAAAPKAAVEEVAAPKAENTAAAA